MPTTNKPNIAFFGTPYFAQIVLEKLIENRLSPELVITAPDKPVGRTKTVTSPPVKVIAEKHGIEVLQPIKLDKELIYKLQTKNYDLFIIAAYGKILPEEILKIPKNGCVNVHPSLLPRWRGPSPIQYSILHGDSITGSTIMLLDEKMDHGPILAQKNYSIETSETTETLTEKLAEQGALLLIEIIKSWLTGNLQAREQDHASATYSKIISRDDGHIDWHSDIQNIELMLRAFTPWPGIFTNWNEKRLKLLSFSTENIENEQDESPGTILKYKTSFAIRAKNGLIFPESIQLEGGKPQSAEEFLRGHNNIIGVQLI